MQANKFIVSKNSCAGERDCSALRRKSADVLSSAFSIHCKSSAHCIAPRRSSDFISRYHSRKFRRRMDLKKSARMTAIPQLDLPGILVDDEEERANKKKTPSGLSLSPYGPISPGTPSPGSAPLHSPSTFLSPTRNSGGSNHQKTFSNTSADLTLQTHFENSGAHPLSAPQGRGSGGYDGHQSTHSAFSFELQEPASGQSSRRPSNRNSRSNSAVSPIQMSQILDDSIWMDSIRRSATLKRTRPNW